MDILDKFQRVVRERHNYAREWKAKTGGKVMGYLCTYVPEELVYAAGVLPVRIFGSHEPQDVTDPHIFGMYCPYCRDCLAQALKGRYVYLDGLTIGHACFHIMQTFGSWRRHASPSYTYHLYVPQNVGSPWAKPCLEEALIEFKASLEGWMGKTISAQALDEAIKVYNRNRSLLRQLYELRKDTALPVSGAEAMEIVLASQLMDKREHNSLLEEFLQELPRRDGVGTRLMVVGSENDDVELIRLIESLGAQVVVDDHCTGSRYFWNEVIPGPDPLKAIAARYIDRIPCPQKDVVEQRRLPHILSLAQDYKVQGAILILQKFCDPHGFDMPVIQSLLNENRIPTLLLETDVTIAAGQFRTRIEAFLEMLQPGID